MVDKNSTADQAPKSTLPGLMGNYTDDELNQRVIDHAKYFTVVQVTRGGFVGGGKNYERHQVNTLEDARVKAKELYEEDAAKRSILIYAVADFAGANGFSRPVESYPVSAGYVSKSDKAKTEKKLKAEARERARQARLSLGEGTNRRRSQKPVEETVDDFMGNPLPMVRVEN